MLIISNTQNCSFWLQTAGKIKAVYNYITTYILYIYIVVCSNIEYNPVTERILTNYVLTTSSLRATWRS